MVNVERVDDATYVVTDPRFTQQPRPTLSSGKPLPDLKALLGPLTVVLAAAAVGALVAALFESALNRQGAK